MKITSGNNSPFFKVLKNRVDDYFTKSNIKKTGNYKLFTKTIVIIFFSLTFYFLPFFIRLPIGIYLSIAVLRGLFMGLAGFNIAHDGAHGSYSTNKKVNEYMGYVFDQMGASSFYWKQKHNIIHHHFTNTKDDDDIDTGNMLRFSPWQKWYKIYIFQWFYAFILYGLLHIQWVFVNDYQKYFTNKIGERSVKSMNTNQKIFFWFSKASYLVKSFIIPIVFFGWTYGILGFLVMEFVCGLSIAIVFQLAHVQQKAQFPLEDINTGNIDKEWAIHQLETTADFATNNPFITWLLGGLNFQVVHHLFPLVSHIHYKNVQKIIKETCFEYGVKYNEYKTFIGAFCDHIVYLWKMGRKPERKIVH